MKALLHISALLLLFCSCTDNDYYHNPFEYDKIIHYSVTLDDDEVDTYYQSISDIDEADSIKNDSLFNKDLYDIVFEHDKISSLSDVHTISKLAEIGFTKREIPSHSYSSIDSTFRFNKTDVYEESFCEPIYRDILVFKMGNTITGWAKYCFECNKHDFVGADYIYKIKPYNIDYNRLEQILKPINNASNTKEELIEEEIF
ncbi:MAG: hypothetical protein R2800_01305 [Flavipsychrobacter sp.]